MDLRRTSSVDPASGPVLVSSLEAVPAGGFGDLSEFFNPFLDRFVREALRGGGEVWLSKENGTVKGVLLYHPLERVGSIFTRDEVQASVLFQLKESAYLFSEFPLGIRPETYLIYSAEPPGRTGPHRFSHPVRLARADDRPAIVQMLNQTYGAIDTSWLQAPSADGDRCFVVEVGGEIVGAAWVSVVGSYGRLHSLSVKPHWRRVGIGTDLWHARMLWARQAGVRQVIAEIWEHNAPSLAIATAGGMRRVGRMFLSHRPGAGRPPPSVDGGPAIRTDLVGHVD